jgi:Flp pilus assembly pilin Flp
MTPWRSHRLGLRGQGIVEYGLILALTAVFTALILGVMGGTLADVLSAIGGAIDAATGGA